MSFSEEYSRKLNAIQILAENLWKNHKLPHYFFTPHDTSHSEGVIKCIEKLIPNPFDSFKEKEYFLLLASAWLHDIGMIPGLFPDDLKTTNKKEYLRIRDEHHNRSKEYITEHSDDFGLSAHEAKIIGLISKYHRRREDINNLENLHDVRVKLLAAYLRIADAINIDSTRVEVYEDLYSLFLAEAIPLSSEFHWLRSFWISDIEVKPDTATLTIHFNFSKDDKVDGLNFMVENTVHDLSEEIDSCKDTLIKERVSYYIDIDYQFGLSADEHTLAKLKQIIAKLKVRNTASSSQLANIIIDTVNYLIDSYKGKPADKIEMIKKYLSTEIREIMDDRPCHVLVKHIHTIISNSLTDPSLDDQTKLELIYKKLLRTTQQRKESVLIIANNSQSILLDCAPILLFGYSSIIIDALNKIDKSIKSKTHIYVLEGRNKNQLNYKNDLTYCDGLRYVLDLSANGFSNVYLVPDSIAGNLIANRRIQKIFFGANTVDIKEGNIGHTAGHLTVIHSAKQYDIPIYVFVDSYKFGDLKDNVIDERNTNWFTGEKKLQNKLISKGIKYYNPRSDVIPLKYVHMFITDVGIFPPTQIPDALTDKLNEIGRTIRST